MNQINLPYQRKLLKLAVTGLLSGAVLYPVAHAFAAAMPTIPVAKTSSQDAPVDFDAETVEYDDLGQKITAEGSVEIVQDSRIIKADKVVYDLQTEIVTAEGNVAILEKNGDVHFSEMARLDRGMSHGYVKKLESVLADGARFKAEEGHQIDANHIEMDNASYTPCEPCKLHPEKPPVWQIKAKKVFHDNEDHTISYKDATFEVKGVPVMYVPYFSHADGTIKQKSGFLSPTFNLSSELGFSATPRYYWAIDPSQDATIGVRTFATRSPLVEGQYRKRYENAKLEFSGSVADAERTDSSGGTYEHIGDELRGNLFGKGLWDIDDKWRAGFKAAVVSDNQYLRQFDIASDDVLENEIYAERFDDRDYLNIRALAFQDTRISNRATDQPNVFPDAKASFLGKPGETLGGRWSLDMSALGLTRNGNGQDVLRTSAQGGWERKDILDLGFVNTISATVRGDAYSVPTRDSSLLGSGNGDSTSFRFYPVINNVTSYPLVNNYSDFQAIIEPTVALTVAPKIKNNTDIPNEDSQDVQLDSNNLFEADRFPGLDRVEDRSRATYGVRTGLHKDDGSKAEVFVGQSYRFSDKSNPFPAGSGLEHQSSNYVGQLNASYEGDYNLNYTFELSSDDLSSEKHELDADANFGKLLLSTSYFFAQSLDGTDLSNSREQLYGSASYYFTDEWMGSASARYDFTQAEKGFRNAGASLTYLGQCFTVTTTAVRNFTFDSTGDSATEFMVRLGLKNLGQFGTSQ